MGNCCSIAADPQYMKDVRAPLRQVRRRHDRRRGQDRLPRRPRRRAGADGRSRPTSVPSPRPSPTAIPCRSWPGARRSCARSSDGRRPRRHLHGALRLPGGRREDPGDPRRDLGPGRHCRLRPQAMQDGMSEILARRFDLPHCFVGHPSMGGLFFSRGGAEPPTATGRTATIVSTTPWRPGSARPRACSASRTRANPGSSPPPTTRPASPTPWRPSSRPWTGPSRLSKSSVGRRGACRGRLREK